jgi:hypothetical protein
VQHANATRHPAREMKPVIRTAQANPTLMKSFCSTRGKMIPPVVEPATAALEAVARTRTKCVCVALTAG